MPDYFSHTRVVRMGHAPSSVQEVLGEHVAGFVELAVGASLGGNMNMLRVRKYSGASYNVLCWRFGA